MNNEVDLIVLEPLMKARFEGLVYDLKKIELTGMQLLYVCR